MSSPFPMKALAQQTLRQSWFPVARGVDLATPQSATLLGQRLVVYRTWYLERWPKVSFVDRNSFGR